MCRAHEARILTSLSSSRLVQLFVLSQALIARWQVENGGRRAGELHKRRFRSEWAKATTSTVAPQHATVAFQANSTNVRPAVRREFFESAFECNGVSSVSWTSETVRPHRSPHCIPMRRPADSGRPVLDEQSDVDLKKEWRKVPRWQNWRKASWLSCWLAFQGILGSISIRILPPNYINYRSNQGEICLLQHNGFL